MLAIWEGMSNTETRSDADLETLTDATVEADRRMEADGGLWVAVDNGNSVWPRFGVTRVPAVGEPVSYACNGDSYPDGVVTKVSAALRITTDSGNVYRRKGTTGAWVKEGGTWRLVHGHVSALNPSF